MKKDFLFVNRSKDTFRQPPREGHAIAAHAQKEYQRKLRAQQILAHQSRTAARASLRASVSGSSGPSITSTRNTSSPEDEADNANRDDQRLRRISVASPTSSLNEYGLSAVPLDKGAYEILQFFLNVETWTLREVWREDYVATTDTHAQQLSNERSFAIRPSGKLDGHKDHYFSALGQIVQGCLNNPVHMYALLTMTACGMRIAAGITTDPQHSPEYFMAKALPHLRSEVSRISNGGGLIDKQILLDIFYLFAHEWWQERYDMALTHLKIVHTLSAQLDPTLPLDRYIIEGSCFDDVMICLESGTQPMRPLDWSPPDLTFPEQVEVKTKLEELRRSGLFRKPGEENYSPRRTLAIFLVPLKPNQKTAPIVVLSPHMGAGLLRAAQSVANSTILQLMRDILFLIDVMQYTWISTSPVSKYAQWAVKKVHAVLHVLLSMHLMGEWECVRLAMVMMLGAMSSNRSWRSGEMNARRIQAALVGKTNHLTVKQTWTASLEATGDILVGFADRKMLLWVLVLGAAKTTRNASHEWFVEQALSTARDLQLVTADELQNVLVEYLYLLRSQQTVVQELAAMLGQE